MENLASAHPSVAEEALPHMIDALRDCETPVRDNAVRALSNVASTSAHAAAQVVTLCCTGIGTGTSGVHPTPIEVSAVLYHIPAVKGLVAVYLENR